MQKFISLSVLERFTEYEKFCANHFGESANVGYPFNKSMGRQRNLKREYYREVLYLDFENYMIPVPVDYETILDAEFGNWREFVRAKSMHATAYTTADISYTVLQKQINNSLRDVEK